jgi:uncharacterized protein YbjT (DUF2867 family)
MKILIFGATGMVGQGVLRECLLDADVQQVQTIGRTSSGVTHANLRDIVHANLHDYASIEEAMTSFDACFFCLGVSSSGMDEAAYTHITYDLTVAAASVLARLNPGMTFTYVSGAGTDSTERGNVMWARVKGRTENALLCMPLKAFMFRPGVIQPLHGIQSKTRSYRIFYSIAKPLFPLFKAIFPRQITTTEHLGRAMLIVAKKGADKHVLETLDITALTDR